MGGDLEWTHFENEDDAAHTTAADGQSPHALAVQPTEVALSEDEYDEIVALVKEDHPPREQGVRDGWENKWGIGRRYDPSPSAVAEENVADATENTGMGSSLVPVGNTSSALLATAASDNDNEKEVGDTDLSDGSKQLMPCDVAAQRTNMPANLPDPHHQPKDEESAQEDGRSLDDDRHGDNVMSDSSQHTDTPPTPAPVFPHSDEIRPEVSQDDDDDSVTCVVGDKVLALHPRSRDGRYSDAVVVGTNYDKQILAVAFGRNPRRWRGRYSSRPVTLFAEDVFGYGHMHLPDGSRMILPCRVPGRHFN